MRRLLQHGAELTKIDDEAQNERNGEVVLVASGAAAHWSSKTSSSQTHASSVPVEAGRQADVAQMSDLI